MILLLVPDERLRLVVTTAKSFINMSASKSDEGRTYHTKATGQALETIEKHQDSTVEMTLYGSCFCPFVQRVWVALEALGMPYNVSLKLPRLAHGSDRR